MRGSTRATRFTTVGLALILSACMAGITKAQTTQTAARPDRGIMPTGSYSVSDIENISMTGGNLNLSIPLASLPPIAGGKLSLTLRATYNSKLWNVTRTENQLSPLAGCGSWVVDTPQISERGGWSIAGGNYSLQFRNAHEDFDYAVPNPPNGGQDCEESITERSLLSGNQWYKLVLITPDGAEHEMRPIDKTPYEMMQGTRDYLKGYYSDTPATTNQAIRYYSTDGTYLWAVVNPFPMGGGPTSWTIYTADGTKITQSNGIQRITDNNGNSIKIFTDTDGTHYQDEQTGREIKVTWSATGNNGQPQTRVWYQTVGGSWMHIDINHGTTHVQGRVYTISDWNPTGGETGGGTQCTKQQVLDDELSVIREIVFPQTVPNEAAQRYSFSYNSDQTVTATDNVRWDCSLTPTPYTRTVSKGTGELSQMLTPSGATVKYTYNFESTTYLPFEANDISRMMITSKSITHDGTTDTWTYNITVYGNSSVTNPDGSTVAENFYPHDPAWGRFFVGTGEKGGLTYRTNQSNKVVVERHWTLMPFAGANTSAPGGSMNFNPVVDAEYTTLMEPGTGGTPAPVKMSAKTFQYDYNGNLLETKEYDWFNPALVTRDSAGVPTGVPAGAVLLRTTTNSYHNSAPSNSSGNIYAKRPLSNPSPLILNAPQETVTGPSQTRFSYDGQGYGVAPTLGNLTKVSSFDNQGDTNANNDRWLHTSTTYDSYGNRTSVTDPNNRVMLFEYDNPANGLVNRVKVDPLNGTGVQTASTEYDLSTGMVRKQYDANGNFTEISYTNQLTQQPDPFGRPGITYSPAVTVNNVSRRRRVVATYEDHLRRVTVASDLNAEGDGLLKSRTTQDELGRTKLVEQSEDGTNYTISSQTVYEQMGKIIYQSNPRRSTGASTDGWTRSRKDVMGRVVEVATFSGAAQPPASGTNANWTGSVTSSYYAQETTVTDQASKSRKSVVDALGRLIKIIEDPQSGGLNYETSYSYDTLGNLTGVTQGVQARAFTYSSVSRLASAQNPESGTIQYQYDPNGNLIIRTDVRGIVTSYGYDGLNRLASRTYSDSTPAVTYTYDTLSGNKGRLASVSSTVSVTNYTSYDTLGRVTASSQVTNGNTYTFNYSYDLAGNLRSQTYPSGRVVETEYDTAGRIAGVKKQGGSFYAGGASSDTANRLQYSAHGAITSMKLGNGLWEHTGFNSRLQPVEIGLGSASTDSSKLLLGYSYGTTNNNGNVQSQTIVAPGLNLTQSYTYDPLNRLKSFQETGGLNQTWNQVYSYDRYGNRNIDVAQTTTDPGFVGENPTFDTSNNRIAANQGYGYDNAGNLIQAPNAKTYIYDAENKQTVYKENNVEKGSYAYDGDGQRVKKEVSGVTTIFVYNPMGQLIAEYGSEPINNGTRHLTADHLGSTRVVTDSTGSVKERHDYLPFGEEIGSYVSGRGNVGQGDYKVGDVRQKFTQYERDVETELDYAEARYYSSTQGRFTSSDPLMASARVVSPQSWNRYLYSLNNPLKYVDPNGLMHQDPQEDQNKTKREQEEDETSYLRKFFDLLFGDYYLDPGQAGDASQAFRDPLALIINPGTAGAQNEVGVADTNVVSGILRGATPKSLGVPSGMQLVITPTVYEELLNTEGVTKEGLDAALSNARIQLRQIPEDALSKAVNVTHGLFNFGDNLSPKMGKAVSQLSDLRILAEAKAINLPILTNNVNDFLANARGGGKLAERAGVKIIGTKVVPQNLPRLNDVLKKAAKTVIRRVL